jgi:hypothetical protein
MDWKEYGSKQSWPMLTTSMLRAFLVQKHKPLLLTTPYVFCEKQDLSWLSLLGVFATNSAMPLSLSFVCPHATTPGPLSENWYRRVVLKYTDTLYCWLKSDNSKRSTWRRMCVSARISTAIAWYLSRRKVFRTSKLVEKVGAKTSHVLSRIRRNRLLFGRPLLVADYTG